MEAAHAGVPLVVVTADRPARLRGTGANQTTDQVGIFGAFAATLDVARGATSRSCSASCGARHAAAAGPPQRPARRPAAARRRRGTPPTGPRVVRRPRRPRCTDQRSCSSRAPAPWWSPATTPGPPARAARARQPAGRCSPSRRAAAAPATTSIRTYRLLLDGELGQQVERVVVAGPPDAVAPGLAPARASRRRGRLGPRTAACGPSAPSRSPPRPTQVRVEDATTRRGSTPGARPTARPRATLDRLLAAEPDLTPHEVAGAVSRALPPGGLLVVGASNPIRDLDLMVARYEVGGRRKVIANRGLAGIDGTISSAIGAALGRPRSSRALALMGDVTFLHDTTGLFLGPREERPDLTIVVVNDDGGSIFAHPRAGRARARRPLRHPLRHPARGRPGRPLRRRAGAAPAGRAACPSSSRPSRCPTAGSRSSRRAYAATTAASWTKRSARWSTPERERTNARTVVRA